MKESNDETILGLFEPDGDLVYLDSATYGIPPRPTIDAVRVALDGWRSGRADWIEDWDRQGEICRSLFASMIHARSDEIALVPAVSVATAMVVSSVDKDGEVLVAEGDFTSLLYPFLAAQERGDLRVREAPVEHLAAAITPLTTLVAVSHVQSSNGRVADLRSIVEAAHRAGARVFVDGSQSVGVLPTSVTTLAIDYLACAAYKWLCCPRGVAFLFVRHDLLDDLSPVAGSWRAGDDPYGRFYGSPLRLSADAARFDISLAWHAWVGARHSLEVLSSIAEQTRFDRAMSSARHLAELLDLSTPESSIVSIPVRDHQLVNDQLRAADIKASSRAGRIRLSFHLYNTPDHAEIAADVLGKFRLASS